MSRHPENESTNAQIYVRTLPQGHSLCFSTGRREGEIRIGQTRREASSEKTISGSMTDVITAHAILAVRSITIRNPRRRTQLIPPSWERRFAPALGSYSSFIKSHSPDIFTFEECQTSGLVTVGFSDEFLQRGYIAYQLKASSGDLGEFGIVAGSCYDPQYAALVDISDMNQRGDVAGGTSVLGQAASVIDKITKKNPPGVSFMQVMKALGEEGLPPIPLEWFDSLVVRTNSVWIFKRKHQLPVKGPPDSSVALVESLLVECSPNPLSINVLAQQLRISPQAAAEMIKNCPTAMYEPDTVFACHEFETLVDGYMSPRSREEAEREAELAKMTPVEHLFRSVELCLVNSPTLSIGSEHVLAWCAALDVKPRTLWQCMQGSIFWSSPHADLEILLRTSEGMRECPNLLSSDLLPREVVAEIVEGIKGLGGSCSVDKLSLALKWGRTSDNRKRYGPLRSVLQGIPEVFYDPTRVYLRSGLEGIVLWPTVSEISPSHPATAEKILQDYANLMALNASIVYYLTEGGYPCYPLSELVKAFETYGLAGDSIVNLSQLFLPGNNVFLRRLATDIPVQQGTVEEAVLFSLTASGRRAVDMDTLVEVLTQCGRFDQVHVDRFRTTLVSSCGDILNPDNTGIPGICFLNPDVVLLDATATRYLEIPSTEMKLVRTDDFIVKAFEQEAVNPTDATPDAQGSEFPVWMKKGVIVSLNGREEEFAIESFKHDEISIQLLGVSPEQHISCALSQILPRTLRPGDRVLIMRGPNQGREGDLIGMSPNEGSVQMSKTETKSIPLEYLVACKR